MLPTADLQPVDYTVQCQSQSLREEVPVLIAEFTEIGTTGSLDLESVGFKLEFGCKGEYGDIANLFV